MEGNACYRYRTIARYVQRHARPSVLTCVDIGCCIGRVAQEILDTFPTCRLWAYDVMPDTVARCRANLSAYGDRVAVSHLAITARHLYADDLGAQPLAEPRRLTVWQATLASGCNWWDGFLGGHRVAYQGDVPPSSYRDRPDLVPPARTLDELIAELGEVDFLKTDCEGSECSFLGAATDDTLQRIRWIGGEYHDLARFYPVKERLRATHRVNLVGDRIVGSFVAERHDETPGLLCPEELTPRVYPHLVPLHPLTWSPFQRDEVPQGEWFAHGLTDRQPSPCCG